MALKIFNTLTRGVEEFKPHDKHDVRIYSCGPTVYNHVHIGNWRGFMFYDIFKRYLKYKKFGVRHIMNITDVDDKTIKGSQTKGVPLKEFTEEYTRIFLEESEIIRLQPPDERPKATDYINEMVELIQRLIHGHYAYKAEDGIYFKISAFKDYGKLSQTSIEKLQEGASGRLKKDEYDKENAQDFALWKFYTPEDGNVFWETPIGKGRPGWHIECSAMSEKLLGVPFDCHLGGVDLMFPHHENEIAQTEAATKKKMAKYWMHNEHLLVDNKKMAKRDGNFYTLRDVLKKGYSAIGIRYLLLSSHYRQRLNFTFEGVTGAEEAVKGINDFMLNLKEMHAKTNYPAVTEILQHAEEEFEKAMDNDLMMPEALAAVFELMHQVNRLHEHMSHEDSKRIEKMILKFNEVLDILKEEEKAPQAMIDLMNQREQARKVKDWKLSDEIRAKIAEKGWIVEDLKEGPRLKKTA